MYADVGAGLPRPRPLSVPSTAAPCVPRRESTSSRDSPCWDGLTMCTADADDARVQLARCLRELAGDVDGARALLARRRRAPAARRPSPSRSPPHATSPRPGTGERPMLAERPRLAPMMSYRPRSHPPPPIAAPPPSTPQPRSSQTVAYHYAWTDGGAGGRGWGGVIRGGSMPEISSGWGAVVRRTLLSRPRSPLRRSSPRCPRPRPSTGPIHQGAARMRMPLRACACARPRSDPRARIGEHARIPTHLFFPPLPRASPPSPRPPHRPRCPPWGGP